MRALLIGVPPFLRSVMPPLNLGYLAAIARERGWEAEIASLTGPASPGPDELRALARRRRPDLIAHTVLSPVFNSSRRLLAAMREAAPGAVVVVGGAHPSALPEHTLTELPVDYAVIGEGERAFGDVLDAVAAGRRADGLPGVASRPDGAVVLGPPRPMEADVDSLPPPAWDLLKPETYPPTPPQVFHRGDPWAPALSSRGCPFGCSFCGARLTMGRGFRPRNPERVVDELERLRRERGVREIQFVDLDLTADPRHAAGLAEALLRRKLDLVWKTMCGIRVGEASDELLRLMRRSGCYQVTFGLESYDPQTLERLNKRIDPQRIDEQLRLVRGHGMLAAAFLIIGAPGETAERAAQSIRRAARSPLDLAGFAAWTPMPDAPDWPAFAAARDLGDFPWETLHYDSAAFSDGIDERRLRRMLRWAHVRFYLSPGRWSRILRALPWRSAPYLLRFTAAIWRGRRSRAAW